MSGGAKADKQEQHGDMEILEHIKNKLYDEFRSGNNKVKVGDLLKVIEMKNKLSVTGKAEKKFWEMINKIREKELTDKSKRTTRKRKISK